MKIGAHVGSSGGLSTAFDRAREMGCETIQIFGAPPKVWRRRIIRPDECASFQECMKDTGIAPVFIHGVYLINLATDNPEQLEKSREALSGDLRLAAAAAISGVIFHIGSHKRRGFDGSLTQIASALSDVIADTPEEAWVVLENSAGAGGGGVGAKFSELGAIIKAVKSPRVKICIDTQHAYAAGYNVAGRDGLDAALEELDREAGLSRLVAVHANDSKVPLGKGVDRHENIGDGLIGTTGFEVILAHPALRDVPFILEVPGLEDQGPDKANVDRLKAIRKKVLG